MDILCVVIVIYIILIYNVLSDSIVVTNETSSAQYYFASLDLNGFNGFSLGTINCANNKDCYVYCDFVNGCSFTEIHAENANNLYVKCSAISTCDNIKIYGPSSSSSTSSILCLANTACSGPGTIFRLNNSANVNIKCVGSTSNTAGSCSGGINIYTPNNKNNVNITCGLYDCQDIKLWVKPLSYNTFLTCNGIESCINMEVICIHNNGKSNLLYNNSNNQWECSDNTCCPLISNNNDIIISNTSNTSMINNINCTELNCINTYIDGKNIFNTMYIHCNNINDCKYNKMICPLNGYCIIDCIGYESCKYSLIDASQSISLQLKCGPYGCQNMLILCPFNHTSCSIQCLGFEYSCNSMQIIQLTDTLNSYLDITCPPPSFTGSCTNITFQCPSEVNKEIYYDAPNKKCSQQSICCPFKNVPTAVTAAPTASPLQSSSSIEFEECIKDYEIYDEGSLSILYNNSYKRLRVTLSGPTTAWFGIGFGSLTMDNTYAIITSGDSFDIDERILANHDEGTSLSQITYSDLTTSILNGKRWIELVLLYDISGSYDFTDYLYCNTDNANNLQIIWANGATLTYGYHKTQGSVSIGNCVCNTSPTKAPTKVPTEVPTEVPIVPTTAPVETPTATPFDISTNAAAIYCIVHIIVMAVMVLLMM